ncbi:MAG: hypothetical protein ACHQT9_01755 [Candidatus Saccharimonadales bacterium]
MVWLFVLSLLVLLCFAGVIFVGAPYLPTLSPQVEEALEMANLASGQTLLELGSGDGKVLLAAARKDIKVIGYELNPILVVFSYIRTLKYRKNVTIIWGNFWTKQWPKADAIFVFLLPKYMKKLDTKCMRYSHLPITLVSFAFEIPGKEPSKKSKGLFTYHYK